MARIPRFVHVVTNVPAIAGTVCDQCGSASVAYLEWADTEGHVVAMSHVCEVCGFEHVGA